MRAAVRVAARSKRVCENKNLFRKPILFTPARQIHWSEYPDYSSMPSHTQREMNSDVWRMFDAEQAAKSSSRRRIGLAITGGCLLSACLLTSSSSKKEENKVQSEKRKLR